MNYQEDDYEDSDEEIILKNNYLNQFQEEIVELEKMEMRLQQDIKSLWDNVIKPYLENYNEKQILIRLNGDADYYKFYSFMMNNSKLCKYVRDKLKSLYEN